MVRIVVSLTPLAKLAAAVATVGGGLAVYGKVQHVSWADGAGTVMLLLGAVVYYVERYRMFRAKRKGK